jgi:hypothetical protein
MGLALQYSKLPSTLTAFFSPEIMVFIHCSSRVWHVSFVLRQHMLFGPEDLLVFFQTRRDDFLSMGAALVRPRFVRSGCCPAQICDAARKTIRIEVCPLTLKIASRSKSLAIAAGKAFIQYSKDDLVPGCRRKSFARLQSSAKGSSHSLYFHRHPCQDRPTQRAVTCF